MIIIKGIILKLFSIIMIPFILISCTSSRSVSSSQEKIEPVSPKISVEKTIGCDMVELDYASEDIIIFHGYFGMFIYDVKETKLIRSLDLKAINLDNTQGDNYCEVSVSDDGTMVQLHGHSSEEMYTYNIEDNSLIKSKYKAMENQAKINLIPMEIKRESHNYMTWAIKFDNDDLGYLISEDFTIGGLKYIRKDKVYPIFSQPPSK